MSIDLVVVLYLGLINLVVAHAMRVPAPKCPMGLDYYHQEEGPSRAEGWFKGVSGGAKAYDVAKSESRRIRV
jgi:hypothetical protein